MIDLAERIYNLPETDQRKIIDYVIFHEMLLTLETHIKAIPDSCQETLTDYVYIREREIAEDYRKQIRLVK